MAASKAAMHNCNHSADLGGATTGREGVCGEYTDAIEVLRRADQLQCLSCPVMIDALPQATSVYDLAKAGAGDPELLKTNPEILDARADFGSTPTLFEKGPAGRSRSAISRDEEAALRDKEDKKDRVTKKTASNAVE